MKKYPGKIHLVYGEKDKYVSKELREQIIDEVKVKNQQYMILPNQDHSSWDYDVAQEVYKKEVKFLLKNFCERTKP